MRTASRLAAATTAVALSAAVLAPLTVAAPPKHAQGNPSGKSIALTHAGTHETGVFDASAAEIPAFDAATGRLFVVNAQKGAIDVLRVGADGAPTGEGTLAVAGLPAADGSVTDAGSVVNSVAVSGGIAVATVEAQEKTDLGWVVFFDTGTLEPLGAVRVGALPDSVAFSPNGAYAVVANEGEPADDFSTDPEGTISVISVPRSPRQFARLGQDSVRTVDFRAYDEGLALPEGVRVFGPDVPVPAGQEEAGRIARSLEPEYVTIDDTGRTAYVSVQEANAVVAVDLKSASIKDFWALQLTDWSSEGVLDASDRDGGVHLRHWPVMGVPMPDGMDTYRWRGQDLVVTANEGDAREWGEYEDSARVKDLTLCSAEFPDAAALQKDAALGRLTVLTDLGHDAERDCHARLHALGGRSFSIYTADGERLFDSAGMIEQQIARLIEAGELPEHAFNANNDETPSGDKRSDDKGPEPESVVVGSIQGRTYAFVGLERVGGVMVFDITDPRNAAYVEYVNDRNWDAVGDDAAAGLGDLGAEGLAFVPASDSPSGTALLIVANEVSGSTTVYEVNPVRTK
ncbi:choice-of-anchor I family protein [Micrococcus endophyticus]|uniref:choice-of-anchor I family protein n=1 Tax=Micrococcus endophyticus TaxID=455343 RepID=UPI0020041DCA|nr:choice-of-anchor I family protein [Micrococcus endophyticus]MCK6090155.1 choice-of-anchor I family protein [Micrococcus endophyticus]